MSQLTEEQVTEYIDSKFVFTTDLDGESCRPRNGGGMSCFPNPMLEEVDDVGFDFDFDESDDGYTRNYESSSNAMRWLAREAEGKIPGYDY